MIYYDYLDPYCTFNNKWIPFFPMDTFDTIERPFIVLKYGNVQNCLTIEIKLDIKINQEGEKMEFEEIDIKQIVEETINKERDSLVTEIIVKIGEKLKSLKELEEENRLLTWEVAKLKSEIMQQNGQISRLVNESNKLRKEIQELEKGVNENG